MLTGCACLFVVLNNRFESSRLMPLIVMCLSVCYLFVSPVSSPVAWWLASSFCLVGLPTSSLLSQGFFVAVVVRKRRGRCILRLRWFLIIIFRGHLFVWCGLLFVILNSLHIKIIRDLLYQHFLIFELSEGIHGSFNAMFVFFFWTALIKHLISRFLF